MNIDNNLRTLDKCSSCSTSFPLILNQQSTRRRISNATVLDTSHNLHRLSIWGTDCSTEIIQFSYNKG